MSENLVEAVVSDIDKLRYPVKPGMTCVIEQGMTVCGQVGYDVCGDPDPTKSSPPNEVIPDSDRGSTPYLKIRSQKSLAEQSDMSENLVEEVVSDIDKLR